MRRTVSLIVVVAGAVLLASCSRQAPPPPGPTGPRPTGSRPTTITFNLKEEVWKIGNDHSKGKTVLPRTATYTFATAPDCDPAITLQFDATVPPTRPRVDHPADPDHDNSGSHWAFDSTSASFPGCQVLRLHEGAVGSDEHGLVSFDLGPSKRFVLFERTPNLEEWADRGDFPELDCEPGGECPAVCRVTALRPPAPDHPNDGPQPHWRIVRGDCVLVAATDQPDHQARVFTRALAETKP